MRLRSLRCCEILRLIMVVLKKNKLSFNCHLYIDKKSNNLKEDPRRKNDSDFDFSQATQCLRGFNKKGCYIVRIIEIFLHQKKMEQVGNLDRLAEGSTPTIKIALSHAACPPRPPSTPIPFHWITSKASYCFAPSSPINILTMARQHTQWFPTPSLFIYSQVKLTPQRLHQHTNEYLFNSISPVIQNLTSNQANLIKANN